MAGPLIVTARLGDSDFAWLDGLRRAHFPAERNHLSAHLTLFHALPPSLEDEARTLLASLAGEPPPEAELASIMDLGGGVAYRVRSDGLAEIRERIAAHFHGCQTAQDVAPWRAHVTIQNKVKREVAVALRDQLQQDFRPRPLSIRGLSLHRYLGGPWAPLGSWSFRR